MKPKEKKHQCIEGKGWACDKKKNIHVTTFQSTGDNNWRHYVEVWSEQGRSEDEIWAVNNFMTGQGQIMLDSLLQEQREEIGKQFWSWYYGSTDMVEDVIEIITGVKDTKEREEAIINAAIKSTEEQNKTFEDTKEVQYIAHCKTCKCL